MTKFTLEELERNRLLAQELRSGRWVQHESELGAEEGIDNRRCCLGVACELYGLKVDPELVEFLDYTAGEAPELVAEWFGWGKYDGIMSEAAHFNDTGNSFDEIARLFETLENIDNKLLAQNGDCYDDDDRFDDT